MQAISRNVVFHMEDTKRTDAEFKILDGVLMRQLLSFKFQLYCRYKLLWELNPTLTMLTSVSNNIGKIVHWIQSGKLLLLSCPACIVSTSAL